MAAQSESLENFLNIVDFVLFGLETNFLGWNGIILKIHLSIAHLYLYRSKPPEIEMDNKMTFDVHVWLTNNK